MLSLEQKRAGWEREAAAVALPEGTEVRSFEVGAVPCEEVRSAQVEPARGRLLLLHGGGYVSGSCTTHREMAARFAELTRLPVVVPQYRLAPEHPFPAAPQDCFAVYRWLLEQGVDPARLIVAGDSAGGGLTLAVMQQAAAEGLPLPCAGLLLSPWLDLELELPSVARNAELDPHIRRAGLLDCAAQYLAGAEPRSPLAAPIHADPTGLPPLYVNVGDLEILLDDALVFVDKARAAGVDTTLRVAEGLWHVYPAWAAVVPECMEEMRAMAAFIGERLGHRA